MRSIFATLPRPYRLKCWRNRHRMAVSVGRRGAAHAGGSALEAAGTAAAGPAAQVAGQAPSSEGSSAAYFTEMLFRTDHPDSSGDSAAARAEPGRILATDALSSEMPAADRTYVAQVIAARTGLSRADAEKRVSDRAGEQRQEQCDRRGENRSRRRPQDRRLRGAVGVQIAADGAFSASYMATVGGRVRDDLPMAG